MSGILTIDKDRLRAEQVTQTIYHHILRDYIADVNRREVMENLYKFFKDSDIAIISKSKLRKYEEMEKTILNIDMLKVNKNG